MQRKSTAENAEYAENCGFWGNSSRGYVLASRGESTLKKSDGDCNTDGAVGYSVSSVFSVVTSF